MIIRLKWGQTEYKGTLESIDSYMNVLLRDTEEFIDGKQTGSLGLVLIRYAFPHTIGVPKSNSSAMLLVMWTVTNSSLRCNNILWMGAADSVEMTDLQLK